MEKEFFTEVFLMDSQLEKLKGCKSFAILGGTFDPALLAYPTSIEVKHYRVAGFVGIRNV